MGQAGTQDEWDVAEAEGDPRLRVLLYSDHPEVREQVRLAVGRRAGRDLAPIEWVETATHAAVVDRVEAGGVDLVILDGEAGKSGGMGVCRQLKDEIFRCPPVLVLIARPQDAWLASWSQADGVLTRPLDPIVVQDKVAEMLRAAVGA
ncbi:two-component system response regulator [Cellulomonas sp. APG4]|uniref:response regulator n=1 Tax=Cellulomonas sp. APG4 TaxID=1538656 RepID=UPI00192A4D89|nr:response regulator transcription factor [Cellulomonas sp. APG4]